MTYSGDNDIKLPNIKIENEKEVSMEFIIDEANDIWKKVKSYNVTLGDQEAADACMSAIRRDHKEFSTSYPVVLRYMAQMGEYSSKAFKDYLNHVKYHPWKSEADYLDSQADYVIRLYKAKNPKWNKTQVNNLRQNIRGTLEQEHKSFKTTVEKYKKEVDEEEAELTKKKIKELTEWYKQNGENIDDLHIRAQIDESLNKKITYDIGKIVSDLSAEIEGKILNENKTSSTNIFELD